MKLNSTDTIFIIRKIGINADFSYYKLLTSGFRIGTLLKHNHIKSLPLPKLWKYKNGKKN